MRNLNLASPAGEIYNRTTPIMLHDLENVLASQTAALFWAGKSQAYHLTKLISL